MEDPKLVKLKIALDQVHDWPSMYLFKFIVPSENQKVAQVEALFNADTAEIRLRQSKNGKYTSVTAREVMTSAEEVIKCYEAAYKIEGIISL
ncbi:MAG: putative lipoic acid-binding regulatory protein [Flammeovirgaceae bacterium]|jgi:putative lipoic acid-binding regulatory protein